MNRKNNSNKLRDSIINELKNLEKFETTDKVPNTFDKKIIKKQVIEESNYHIKGNKIAPLFLDQLIELYGNGYVTILDKKHPYIAIDIYSSIEAILTNPKIERSFKNKNSKLYGKNIYHAHHSTTFYIHFNLIRCFKNKYKTDNDIRNRLNQIVTKNPKRDDPIIILINEVLFESIKSKKNTGQWIVYQRINSEYNFLCLHLHDNKDVNDENLYLIIKNYFKCN